MNKNRKIFKLWFILFLSCPVLSQTTFTSVITGDWDDGATWGNASPGTQGTDWPSTTDHAVVANGHTVSLTTAETIVDLTIDVGGVLDDDNKGDITVDGNLIINGTITGTRNIQFTGGSGQTIDGTGVHNSSKDIIANGATTISSSANLTLVSNFEMSGSITVTNNGNISINTDLKGASGTWVNATNATLKIGKNLLNGGGSITASATGNTISYNRDGGQSIKLPTGSTYYNLTIEGTGAKTVPANLTISGNLTITSGELDTSSGDVSIAGDFTNSGGTFTENSNVVIFDGTGAQTITTATGETFYDFTVNKASGTFTLASDVIISNAFALTAGTIDSGSNTLTLGTGTGVEGTLTYTAGHIIGLFERWIASGTAGIDVVFPVGSSSNTNTATINFTAISTGGTVLFQFVESAPGNTGLSLVDGATTIYNTFADGYWEMSTANSFNLTGGQTYSLDLDGTGFTAFPIDAATRLLTRVDAGSNWTAEGTHVSAVNPTAMRSGLSSEGAQYAFGDDTNCTGPITSTITGSNDVCTSDSGEAYSVVNTFPNTYEWTIVGGTLVSGDGTANITVNWGTTGQVGNVSVVESNICTMGATVSLSVDINSIAPTSITGKTNVAESTTGEPYSATNRTGYTYTWTITGGTQASGGTTNNITIDWGTAGVGNVSVVAQKSGCTAAAAYDIDVFKYIVINSAQTGNWASGTTWETGSIPLSTENARVLNSHTVTLTADETIDNMVIDAGGTVTTTNKILNIDGDFTVNGIYSGGSKVLDIQGANATIDGTGTISVSGSNILLRNGNKTIASTAVLKITAGDFEFKEANITLTNNGSISITDDVIGIATSTWTNAANSTLKVGGTLGLTTSVFNASASRNTVEYNGTGAQTIITASSSMYYNLTASTSGTKTTAASLDINGDLTISGTATLDVNANTSNLTVAGDWSNSGTFTQGSQAVTLNGSSPQIINGMTTTTFNNLTINNTGGGVTLSTPVIIGSTGTLTMTSGIVTTDAANILTVNSGGTSTSGNASSYLDGPMKKIGNTDFGFPLGDGAVWAPVDVATTVGGDAATEFTAQYFFSAAPNPTDLPGAGLDHVSELEYWEVANGGTIVTSADLSLYWKDADRSEITDLTTGVGQDLVVVHYNSGTPEWEVLSTTIDGASTVGSGGTGFITATFTSFSPISFGSVLGLNALPVELVYFRGKLHSNGLALTWQTASELNNDFFEVEVSTDGENYSTLAIIEGQGTTTSFTNYEYLGRYPASGISYYRLRQVDFNGDFTYSNIISVMNDAPARLYYSAYPQPASSQLTLQLSPIDDTSVMNLIIYNVNGRIIKNFSLDPKTKQIPIDISAYMNGIYFIHLIQAEQAYRGRLLIQK